MIERLFHLNPVISMIEDGIVGEDGAVRFERDFGQTEIRGVRSMAKVDGRLPDDVARLLHRHNGRLAGVFTQTQPSGRRQLEHVVGVENLGLRYCGPVGRCIVRRKKLRAD